MSDNDDFGDSAFVEMPPRQATPPDPPTYNEREYTKLAYAYMVIDAINSGIMPTDREALLDAMAVLPNTPRDLHQELHQEDTQGG